MEWKNPIPSWLAPHDLQWSALKNGGEPVPLWPVITWSIFLSSGRKVSKVYRRKLWLNNDSAPGTALGLYYGVTQNLLEHIRQKLSHENMKTLYDVTPKYVLHLFTAVFSWTMSMASTPVLSLMEISQHFPLFQIWTVFSWQYNK